MVLFVYGKLMLPGFENFLSRLLNKVTVLIKKM